MENSPQRNSAEKFDYVVVGSGAGGGPLAARLALGGCRVLLIEAGPDHRDERVANPAPFEVSLVPGLHGVSTEHSDLSWQFFVSHYDDPPPAGRDDKWDEKFGGIFYPRATGVGGCTVHNAMITVAGPDSDWDELAEFLEDDSWQARRMRAYFQRLERNEYLPRPKPPPTRWWAKLVDDVKWILGFEPNHTGGRHGFDGWLHTTVTDVRLGLHDKQLLNMIKAALLQARSAGLERTWTLVSRFVKGKINADFDPNHAETQANSPEGLILVPLSICGGRGTTIHQNAQAPFVMRGRRSSPREWLYEVKQSHPDKLTIWTNCFVTKVLFDPPANAADPDAKPRACGVEFLRGERLYEAHPDPSQVPGQIGRVFVEDGGEVVLCGGTFNTPQLLMLSGIGERAQLEAAAGPGVDNCVLHGRDGQPLRRDGQLQRVDLPGVGRNLQDRYEVTVISEMRKDFSLLDDATFLAPTPGAPVDPHLARWRKDGTGLYTSNGAVVGILKRSNPDLAQPDLFIFGVPLPFEGYAVGYSKVGKIHDRFSWVVLKSHTRNYDGTVRLRSADPLARPAINFHYFNERSRPNAGADDPDVKALVDGVKFVRGIGARTRFATKEVHPGVEVADDEAIGDWVRRNAWGHHACGTCRMGPEGDPKAVLDARFRVRGVAGLRVVDASIFPKIPGYFIVTNIYVASEKAADVILDDRARRPAPRPTYPYELWQLERDALNARRAHVTVGGSPLPAIPNDPPDWPDDVTGIGLSGGGIRSGTFNLGVLQALARGGWLRRIDLLSTVSGGGYIGSFLGRCFDHRRVDPLLSGGQRTRPAIDLVEADLTDANSRAVGWLRRHGNYIAPNGGGDSRLNAAVVIRNFFSVHFVVGALLFTLFGLVNAVRYGALEPVGAALGLTQFDASDLPVGHLLGPLLGPFFSPWFILFELVLLFVVVPRIMAYWLASQERPERFQPVTLTITFVLAAAMFYASVSDAAHANFKPQPFLLGTSLLTSVLHVELAWRRGRAREAAVGRGNVETQRLRTRNYLTYDLGFALVLASAALAFALIDSAGHALQQWAAGSHVYTKAFGSLFAALIVAVPLIQRVAALFASQEKGGPSINPGRIIRRQIMAGMFAAILFTLPLVAYSFGAHVAFQGGDALRVGLFVTALAAAVSLLLTRRTAIAFVNRSSLAQTYGARLARAYLGASNPLRHRAQGGDITEVMPGDDVASIRDYRPHEVGGPLHLINVTVNQTIDFASGRGNRDRKGENMAVSALAVSIGARWHSRWGDPAAADPAGAAPAAAPAKGAGSRVARPVSKRPQAMQALGDVSGTDHPLIDETGAHSRKAEMLSLRQWMSISGAAVGPGRGQTTRLGTALLFGMANLRTGHWWDSGIDEVARDGFPKLTFLRRLLYVLSEFFQTQTLLIREWIARYPGPWERFWHLSDGGFFEMTGGYELIRRRVPRIILSDASADPEYHCEGFADFVRKVRIDFEAHVEPFTEGELAELVATDVLTAADLEYVGTLDQLKPTLSSTDRAVVPSKKHAALFRVRYEAPPRQRGSVLLYLKAATKGTEDADIKHYQMTHPQFPHEPTEDQVFDEAQWESYRRLGERLTAPMVRPGAWFWKLPLPPEQ